MANEQQPWDSFLRGLLADDAELANYVAGLSPRTPLNRAVEGYVQMLKSRVALTPEEAEAAEQILSAMQQQGSQDANQFLEALERGEMEPATRRRRRKVRGELQRWEPDPGGA
jgi:hypothetical protein